LALPSPHRQPDRPVNRPSRENSFQLYWKTTLNRPCYRCRVSHSEIVAVTTRIRSRPLTAQDFAAFGQVIEKQGAEHFPINRGKCIRFHDLARIETTGLNARPLISILASEPFTLPLTLTMVERHPLGSQAFFPLSENPFLVVVCEDNEGIPATPQAFVTRPGQGINLDRNVWHGVLTPLGDSADFLVVDRGGEGVNLEEHHFDEPYVIE
jgi:ureidoglycolate lyase